MNIFGAIGSHEFISMCFHEKPIMKWFRGDLPSYGENTKRDVFIKKEINQCHIEHKNSVLGLGVGWFG